MKKRCPWLKLTNAEYVEYHDKEWGVPVHDDRLLFEMLILEGAQAGLSWETILKKRAEYKKVFKNFDPKKVAKMTAADQKKLMQNPGIVRNRLKIDSTITNAKAFLEIQKEFGSFDKYLWPFVEEKPIQNKFKKMSDYPSRTEVSDRISKDLKKRGFRFVGTTIIYAYMQAVGLTNDHSVDCFCK
jgi:DNA-3-methyladenine glycosylase I